jgi:hypothetical protein
MARKRMPDLPDTGRRYVENTIHARLASPGIERFRRPADRRGARLALAVALALALLAAMVWLARSS